MMDGSGSVNFKAYFLAKHCTLEVRRFLVPSDKYMNFAYLNNKLESIFDGLREKPFTVSWKDPEDDDVVIGSDEELQIALSLMDGRTKKFYVKPRNELPHARPHSANGAVICDGCTVVVKGVRYKCVECTAYGHCESCEAKHHHKEHMMLRIPENMPVKIVEKLWNKIGRLSSFVEKSREVVKQGENRGERINFFARSRQTERGSGRAKVAYRGSNTPSAHSGRSDNGKTKNGKIDTNPDATASSGPRCDNGGGTSTREEEKPKNEFPIYDNILRNIAENYEFFASPSADGTELKTGIRARNPNDPLAKQFETIGNAVASLLNPLISVKITAPGEKEIPADQAEAAAAAAAAKPTDEKGNSRAFAELFNPYNMGELAKQLAENFNRVAGPDYGKVFVEKHGEMQGKESGGRIVEEEIEDVDEEGAQSTEKKNGKDAGDNNGGETAGKERKARRKIKTDTANKLILRNQRRNRTRAGPRKYELASLKILPWPLP